MIGLATKFLLWLWIMTNKLTCLYSFAVIFCHFINNLVSKSGRGNTMNNTVIHCSKYSDYYVTQCYFSFLFVHAPTSCQTCWNLVQMGSRLTCNCICNIWNQMLTQMHNPAYFQSFCFSLKLGLIVTYLPTMSENMHTNFCLKVLLPNKRHQHDKRPPISGVSIFHHC